MAYKLQVRGTQLDAWYAAGFGDHAQCDAAAAPLLVADAGSGVFGGSKIKVTSNALGPTGSAYPLADNWALATGAISILIRIVPSWTGNPGGPVGLFATGTVKEGSISGAYLLGVNSSSELQILWEDDLGNVIINASLAGHPFTFVSGQPIDIWVTWDGSTTAGAIKVYSAPNGQVAALLGTLTASVAVASRNRTIACGMNLGSVPTFGASETLYINEFVVFDTVENPISYGVRTGFIPTSASQFSGYTFTDPGVANVRSGTTYTFQGLLETGTLVVPTAGQVKSGVSFGSGGGLTGTYMGDDFWSDPGVANVKHGVNYKVDSLTNNRTGTYQGNDEWSDPGITNVRAGVSYLVDGVTLTGTLQLLTNTMSQLQLKQNPSIGQALVMTQGDAFTFDFLAIDDTGSPFDLTGATFSTRMLQEDGSNLVIPNSQHTPNPDQSGHKGEFTMFINGTSTLKTGTTRTIITTVTVNSDVLQFRGTINVLPAKIS